MLNTIIHKIRKIAEIANCLLIKDNWQNIKQCDVLLIGHDNDRGFRYNDKSYSQILDSISWHFGESATFSNITTSLSKYKSFETYGEVKTFNRTLLLIKLSVLIRNLFGKKGNYLSKKAVFWKKVVLRSNAKMLIVIQPEKALCIAAHELGVPVYDIQHGVISESMPYYGEQFTQGCDTKALPTGYLCWDSVSCNVLKKWTVDRGIQVYNVGNPWLGRFATPSKNDDLVNSELQKIYSIQNIGSEMPHILVTLQWGLADYYPEFFKESEEIHKELITVISETCKSVRWFVRLHPVQLTTDAYKRISLVLSQYDGVDIDLASSAPLPALLTEMDGHVTWDSSSVIEATQLRVPSFVLNPNNFSSLQTPKNLRDKVRIEEPLPYLEQEKKGFVVRSKKQVDAHFLKDWVMTVREKSRDVVRVPDHDEFNKSLILSIMNEALTGKQV